MFCYKIYVFDVRNERLAGGEAGGEEKNAGESGDGTQKESFKSHVQKQVAAVSKDVILEGNT